MEYKEGFFNSYVNYFISSFIKSYGNIALKKRGAFYMSRDLRKINGLQ
jgi:hypothetical protein